MGNKGRPGTKANDDGGKINLAKSFPPGVPRPFSLDAINLEEGKGGKRKLR